MGVHQGQSRGVSGGGELGVGEAVTISRQRGARQSGGSVVTGEVVARSPYVAA